MNLNKEGIMILAAHPDDEILGCGGTIARLAQQGHPVTAVIVCEGESLRYGSQGIGQTNHIHQAAQILGIEEVRLLSFPDQKLETFTHNEIILALEAIIQEKKPSHLFVQYGGDVNTDHQMLFRAAMVVTRPTTEFIRTVLAFETASSTEWAYPRSFVPDTWVDISSTLEKKLEAMACYISEVREYPHPRSIAGLRNKAMAWGNQCCMTAAEVFMTIRKTVRDNQNFL
ncbi:MAG: PIG-L family deacetylase [Magnetococcus sp. YQC-5]